MSSILSTSLISTSTSKSEQVTKQFEIFSAEIKKIIREYHKHKHTLSPKEISAVIETLNNKIGNFTDFLSRDNAIDYSMLCSEFSTFAMETAYSINPLRAFLARISSYGTRGSQVISKKILQPKISEYYSSSDNKSIHDKLQDSLPDILQQEHDLENPDFIETTLQEWMTLQLRLLSPNLSTTEKSAIAIKMEIIRDRMMNYLRISLEASTNSISYGSFALLDVKTLSTEEALELWIYFLKLMFAMFDQGRQSQGLKNPTFDPFRLFFFDLEIKILYDYFNQQTPNNPKRDQLGFSHSTTADYFMIRSGFTKMNFYISKVEVDITITNFTPYLNPQSINTQNVSTQNMSTQTSSTCFDAETPIELPKRITIPGSCDFDEWALLVRSDIMDPITAKNWIKTQSHAMQLLGNLVHMQLLENATELASKMSRGTASGKTILKDAKNSETAVKYIMINFTNAAESGLATAQFNLGILYEGALDAHLADHQKLANPAKAYIWFQQALQQRFCLAQLHIANHATQYNYFLPRDAKSRNEFLHSFVQNAAKQGLREAQALYATHLKEGFSTTPDLKAFLTWRLKSHSLYESVQHVFTTNKCPLNYCLNVIITLLKLDYNLKELLSAFREEWIKSFLDTGNSPYPQSHPNIKYDFQNTSPYQNFINAVNFDDYKTGLILLGLYPISDINREDGLGNTVIADCENSGRYIWTMLMLQFGADCNVYYNDNKMEFFSLLYRPLVALCEKNPHNDFPSTQNHKTQDNKNKSDLSLSKVSEIYILQELLKHLLLHKINVNLPMYKKDSEEILPLLFVIKAGLTKTSEQLIENGADVNIRGIRSHTPLTFALENKQFEIASLLLNRGASIKPIADYFGANTKKNLFQCLATLPKDLKHEIQSKHYKTFLREVENLLHSGADHLKLDLSKVSTHHKERFKAIKKSVFRILLDHDAEIYFQNSTVVFELKLTASEKRLRLSTITYTFESFATVLKTIFEDSETLINDENVLKAIKESSKEYKFALDKTETKVQNESMLEVTNLMINIKMKISKKIEVDQDVMKIINLCEFYNTTLSARIPELSILLDNKAKELAQTGAIKKSKSKETEKKNNDERKTQLEQYMKEVVSAKTKHTQILIDLNKEYDTKYKEVQDACDKKDFENGKTIANTFVTKFEKNYADVLSEVRELKAKLEDMYDAITRKFQSDFSETLRTKREMEEAFEIEQQQEKAKEAKEKREREEKLASEIAEAIRQKLDTERRAKFQEKRAQYFKEKEEKAKKEEALKKAKAIEALKKVKVNDALQNAKDNNASKRAKGFDVGFDVPAKPLTLLDFVRAQIGPELKDADSKAQNERHTLVFERHLKSLEECNDACVEANLEIEQMIADAKREKADRKTSAEKSPSADTKASNDTNTSADTKASTETKRSKEIFKVIYFQRCALLEILAETMEHFKKIPNKDAAFSDKIARKLRNYLYKGTRFIINPNNELFDVALKLNQDIIHMIYEVIFFIKFVNDLHQKEKIACPEDIASLSSSISSSLSSSNMLQEIQSDLFHDLLKEAEDLDPAKRPTFKFCTSNIVFFENNIKELNAQFNVLGTQFYSLPAIYQSNTCIYQLALNFSKAALGTFSSWIRKFHYTAFSKDSKEMEKYNQYIQEGNAIRHCDSTAQSTVTTQSTKPSIDNTSDNTSSTENTRKTEVRRIGQ